MTLDYASQFETRNTQDKQESAGKKSEEEKTQEHKTGEKAEGEHTQEKSGKEEHGSEKAGQDKSNEKTEAAHKQEDKEEAKGHDDKKGHDKDGEGHNTAEKGHEKDGDHNKAHANDSDPKHEGDKEGEHGKTDTHGKTDSHGKADTHGAADHSDGGHGHSNPLSPEALFSHVLDTEDIHLPPTITRLFMNGKPKLDSHGHPVKDKDGNDIMVPHDGVVGIPQPLKGTISYQIPLGEEHTKRLRPLDLNISRLMVVELIAALIIFVVFTWLARQIRPDRATKGRIAGLLETIVQFVRRDVGIAVMGKGDGKRFAPFLLTIFFFVLGCNLLGMIPTVGAPTGDILVTASLALCVFATVVYAGMQKFGFVGFFGNLVPTMGVEGPLGLVLSVGMFFIELFGFFVKHFVLAVRLFANIMAGHLVLAAIIGFIALTYHNEYYLVYLVAPASVAGSVALSCLEVFVAFLQAYVFTFLSALFISSATHKH